MFQETLDHGSSLAQSERTWCWQGQGAQTFAQINVPGSNWKVRWTPEWDLFRWAAFSGCQHCSLMPGQRTHGQHWVTTASTWFTRNSVLLLCQEQETKAGEQIIPVLGCWAGEGLSPLVMRRESLCGFEVQSFPLASWAALLEEPVMGAVTESWAVGLAEVFHEGLSPWHTLDWLGSSSMKSHSTFLSKNFHLYPVMSSPH